MNTKAVWFAAAATMALSACVYNREHTTEVVRETKSIEKGKVEMVRVELKIQAGEVEIVPGSAGLMEAEFEYNVPSWKPDVRYSETGFRGRLTVEQNGSMAVGNVINKWKLRLQEGVPMDLHVAMGAGEGTLKMAGLLLRRVDVQLGAGDLKLDLRGDWKKDCDIQVRGGVGEATVYLPRHVGVQAHAAGGIGEIQVRGLHKDGSNWVNERYKDSDVRLNVDVRGGVGQINLISDE